MTSPDVDGDDWLVSHEVIVETYQGETSDGASWAPPQTVRVGLEQASELGRDTNGDEITLSGRMFAALALLPRFTPESRVLVNNRPARVVKVDVFDGGAAGDPDLAELDHLEVTYA